MKNRKGLRGLIIGLAILAAHFCMDIYKIGVKDGKMHKADMVVKVR